MDECLILRDCHRQSWDLFSKSDAISALFYFVSKLFGTVRLLFIAVHTVSTLFGNVWLLSITVRHCSSLFRRCLAFVCALFWDYLALLVLVGHYFVIIWHCWGLFCLFATVLLYFLCLYSLSRLLFGFLIHFGES